MSRKKLACPEEVEVNWYPRIPVLFIITAPVLAVPVNWAIELAVLFQTLPRFSAPAFAAPAVSKPPAIKAPPVALDELGANAVTTALFVDTNCVPSKFVAGTVKE